jgi:AraC family transcriptional regulator of adaptative response/methylated-DNA-[protein]-cysteine methyltransferase
MRRAAMVRSSRQVVEAVINDDETRWKALVSRDEAVGDAFVYAVRTTGIFCKPGCASRRPRRTNVEFFDRAADAIRSGYRPCKRCRPLSADTRTNTLERACAMLSGDGAAPNPEVARSLGMSPSYFQRMFKKHLGITPQQYRRRVLAEAGRSALRQAGSVTETVYAAGYSSSSRFYEGVGRELGMPPSTALRGGVGETIQYSTSSCSLGAVLVAWTAVGICEVSLGDDGNTLAHRLRSHFPKAALDRCDPSPEIIDVIEAVDSGAQLELPLDLRGTAFQERVWQALMAIPSGETRTYTEIAEALDVPSATRAVANACAKNRLAVLVPCHRVVRKDGGIAGYRWGMERKQQLLEREAEAVEKR